MLCIYIYCAKTSLLYKTLPMGELSEEEIQNPKPRRPFCHTCCKPLILCICNRIQTPLSTSTRVTILQHTDEKSHPCGSARVAALGLQNLEIIPVRDLEPSICRIRPKVPGSKRSIAGRIGSKGRKIKKEEETQQEKEAECQGSDSGEANDVNIPEWINLSSDSALLYPSEKAVDLLPGFDKFQVKHLVVLDGTWGKARRIYCENPWLSTLPHLRLPVKNKSIYSEVRRQPKPGCLSTIESIVYALKILEPEIEGLDDLLRVFDSMVGDQRRCKDERLRKLVEEAS